MKFTALLVLFPVLFFQPAAHADTSAPVTRDDVLKMMADVPACEHARCKGPRGLRQAGPNATEIADAIVAVTDGSITGNPRLDAALMATYAEFESDGTKCAQGDWDPVRKVYRSFGTWQERTATWVACTPAYAAKWWHAAAKQSMTICGRYPYAERLAVLNSGYCHVARGKARHRFVVAVHAALQ